jgi:hypothetical protein
MAILSDRPVANKIDPPRSSTERLLLQPVPLASQQVKVRVVDDPVNDRHRHVVVVEELPPAGEVLVGGDDQRPVLVEPVDQLEQRVARLPAHR